MDYRLVPYIKKYLHEGYSLDTIRQNLIGQGIPDSDIKQASLYAMDEGTKEVKKSVAQMWIVPAILVVLILGAGFYFKDPITIFAKGAISQINTDLAKKPFWQLPNETQNRTQITQQQNPPAQNPPDQNLQPPSSCDMDCLVQAAQSCSPDNTQFSSETDFFGMTISSSTYYEIRPGARCALYIKTVDTDVDFSDELRSQAIANGLTEGDIELQLEQARDMQKTTIGRDGTCVFDDTQKLVEFLQKTKDGSFHSVSECHSGTNGSGCTYGGDWLLGQCTGTMFR